MQIWKRLSLSVATAILLTGVALHFYPGVGEFVWMPGIVIGMFSELIVTILFTSGDNFFMLPWGSYFVLNVLFYTALFILLSWLKQGDG